MDDSDFPHGQLHAIAYDLVMGEDKATLDHMDEGEAFLRGADGRTRMWILRSPVPADFSLRLIDEVKTYAHEILEILLLGGDEAEREKVREGLPFLSRGFVSFFQLSAAGDYWAQRKPRTPLGRYVARGGRGNAAPDYPAMRAQVADRANATMNEWRAFGAMTRRHKVVASWGIGAAILGMFALQLSYGATKLTPLLARMGGLRGSWVEQGEWYRLISCGFLHAGVPHLLFNLMALLIFGPQLEALLGTARFLLLYAGALLGGSLLSMATQSSVSVGASGALWGLMAALFILAWRSKGVLPPAVQRALFSAAAQNLALNLVGSFRPGVDWAAHAGGGIAGAAIMLALMRRLPTLSSTERPEASSDQAWLRPAAVGALALLAFGALLGPLRGKPWIVFRPPVMRVVPLTSNHNLVVEVPVGLATGGAGPSKPKGEDVFGEFLHDGAVLGVRWQFAYFHGNERVEYLDRVYADLAEHGLPGAQKQATKVTRANLGGRDAVVAEAHLPSGVRETRIVSADERSILRVEYVRLGELPESWQSLGERAFLSIRPGRT